MDFRGGAQSSSRGASRGQTRLRNKILESKNGVGDAKSIERNSQVGYGSFVLREAEFGGVGEARPRQRKHGSFERRQRLG